MGWIRDLVGKVRGPNNTFSYTCTECGEVHSDFSVAFEFPAEITGWPEQEIKERVYINDPVKPDLIVVDDKQFYVRSVLEIPIQGTDDILSFGVWPTLSEESFFKYQDLYFSNDREGEEAFSWQLARMPGYTTTDDDDNFLPLKAMTIWRKPPLRPLVFLLESDHQLYLDQINGVTKSRAEEIAGLCLHPAYLADE